MKNLSKAVSVGLEGTRVCIWCWFQNYLLVLLSNSWCKWIPDWITLTHTMQPNFNVLMISPTMEIATGLWMNVSASLLITVVKVDFPSYHSFSVSSDQSDQSPLTSLINTELLLTGCVVLASFSVKTLDYVVCGKSRRSAVSEILRTTRSRSKVLDN